MYPESREPLYNFLTIYVPPQSSILSNIDRGATDDNESFVVVTVAAYRLLSAIKGADNISTSKTPRLS